MNDENLAKLIECEKRSKEEVEKARKDIMKSRARAKEDSLEEISAMRQEQENRLKAIEDEIDKELGIEKKKADEELEIQLANLRKNLGDVGKLVDFIVKGVADKK